MLRPPIFLAIIAGAFWILSSVCRFVQLTFTGAGALIGPAPRGKRKADTTLELMTSSVLLSGDGNTQTCTNEEHGSSPPSLQQTIGTFQCSARTKATLMSFPSPFLHYFIEFMLPSVSF